MVHGGYSYNLLRCTITITTTVSFRLTITFELLHCVTVQPITITITTTLLPLTNTVTITLCSSSTYYYGNVLPHCFLLRLSLLLHCVLVKTYYYYNLLPLCCHTDLYVCCLQRVLVQPITRAITTTLLHLMITFTMTV